MTNPFNTVRVSGVDQSGGPVTRQPLIRPAYGPVVTVDASAGNEFLITLLDSVAFVINIINPPPAGQSQRLSINPYNNGGGVGGAVSFGAMVYPPTSPYGVPGDGEALELTYLVWDGTMWMDLYYGAAIP